MRVAVVGAGLAGLTAAGELHRGGHDVIVLDKGRSPGGRMATRRIGGATLDHGAQFFTVRSDEFARIIAPHLESGLVYEWCRGFSADGDGFPRYAVRGGMNQLPRALAPASLVRCSTLVFAVRPHPRGRGWQVAIDDGTNVDADAVVMTCPLPQSSSLLITAEIDVPEDLRRTDYDRTMAVLATLDGPSAVAPPGGLQHPTATLSFVADNRQKGVSATSAMTIHANAAWSEAHWNDDAKATIAALLAEAGPFLGNAIVVESQLKKWRFATPRTIWPDACWLATSAAGPVVIAGDAFAGPRVEGAVLSGLAASRALLDR